MNNKMIKVNTSYHIFQKNCF